ncbi:hypothetical protein THII_3217 [Thioploca ingrica]|uniref:Uncharacterized protein n=1 Tax=Thioploca ingrica TaxID=40754 RepID=A0A090AJA5_9GAMM|nr:hypothetical protein THII_3217 [Thioploca ingrica]
MVGLFLLPSLTLGLQLQPGFDLFKTGAEGGTSINFSSRNGPIVPLQGNSELLVGQPNSIDTIVYRQSGVNLPDPLSSVGTVAIQLVALSLKSTNSFDIGFLGFPAGTRADLYVIIDAPPGRIFPPLPLDNLQPSIGTMTIQRTEWGIPDGGSFSSTLSIYADLIFVRAGGSLNNSGDWLYHTPDPMAPFVLNGLGTWSNQTPSNNYHNLYPAGSFYPISITHQPPPQGHIHTVQIIVDEFGHCTCFTCSSGSSELLIPLEPPKVLTKLKTIFTSSPITLNKNNQLPYRFGTGSLKKTRQRNKDDNSLPKLDTTSQAFLTTLEDSLAAFKLTEIIVEMSEDMSRLEIPIITAAEDETPQAWYSVLATQPIAIINQEEPLTGLSVKDNGIVSLVFVGHDQQYYESALLPTLDSTIAAALMEAVPAAIIEQSLDGETTFTLGNEVHRVKMDYVVTAIDSNSSQLLVDMTDVNGDQKMDYILSAQGKQQIAFGQ